MKIRILETRKSIRFRLRQWMCILQSRGFCRRRIQKIWEEYSQEFVICMCGIYTCCFTNWSRKYKRKNENFNEQLMVSIDGIEKALKQINSQQYVLNINGIYDENLRSILADYSFEFYAAKLTLGRDYDKNLNYSRRYKPA